MKTLKLLIASLLLVTQSYAFSKSERNILLGLGVGALVVAAANAKDVHITRVHHTQPRYVDSHYDRRMHTKQIKRENRRHERQVRRENLRHERHYDRHQDRRARKHEKRHHRSHARSHRNESYAYNYDHRPHRSNHRY